MTAVPAPRDPFLPASPAGRVPAFGLALLAHVGLVIALALGVQWRQSDPTPVSAELWSAVPQAAAPRAVEPPPPPVPAEPPPRKAAAATDNPPPVVRPDPQIALAQARQAAAERQRLEDEAREREAQQRKKAEAVRQAKEDAAQEKRQALKDKAEKDKAERLKADRQAQAEAAQLADARAKQLERIKGMAGATGGASDTGQSLHSSAPSAGYAGRIKAQIRPNVVFNDPVNGNPLATVEVTLAPDGSIIARRLVKSSGVRSWDDAVLRAIDKTEKLPRDTDGRVPPPFQIDFRPHD